VKIVSQKQQLHASLLDYNYRLIVYFASLCNLCSTSTHRKKLQLLNNHTNYRAQTHTEKD